MHVGQPEVTPTITVGQMLVVHAHQVKGCRPQIIDLRTTVHHVIAVVIRGTMDHTATDTTTINGSSWFNRGIGEPGTENGGQPQSQDGGSGFAVTTTNVR